MSLRFNYQRRGTKFSQIPRSMTAHFGEMSVEIAKPGILAQNYQTFWRTFGGNLA